MAPVRPRLMRVPGARLPIRPNGSPRRWTKDLISLSRLLAIGLSLSYGRLTERVWVTTLPFGLVFVVVTTFLPPGLAVSGADFGFCVTLTALPIPPFGFPAGFLTTGFFTTGLASLGSYNEFWSSRPVRALSALMPANCS